ncbi:peptidylprolyl isomerase [Methyloradius palustris]|uniref:Chaperone SurA n=1 Tax=Methyloradius palustris TaxID=2778876 RepID=A0A8D5GCJ9_9PROT|nr:peptidylprolyl isomerase [Methyloradius palustris]BCM25786.1 chaperone SurA [Methyloradius palustris]
MSPKFLATRFLYAAFLAITFSTALHAEESKIDRIVAVVDQGVITENELNDRIRIVTTQLEKQGNPLPPQAVLQKQILERLINDRLQLQYAAQTGLRVDDAQLDKTVERIADQNKMSVPDFRQALAAEGIGYRKFREDIRNEIILARLREREVDNKINITEAEIDNYFTTQSSQNNEAKDEYEISHILIRTREDSSPEDLQRLRTKAEQALKQLQTGTPFSQVSASFSDAPNALEGGALGWKNSGQIPALFTDALKQLQPGQLTPILRSPNGFHILKLTNRRGGSSPTVIQQTHARHILIKLSEVVSESDAKHRMDDIKERLDNGGNFADLARQYSEDGSASNGGDLGWLNPGDTVPEFEKAMNELKDNEISQPIRTPFGWHIIQVLERRNQDMSKESARLKARQEIRTRKADEAYQDWVRELRDRAFVEIRLEDKY